MNPAPLAALLLAVACLGIVPACGNQGEGGGSGGGHGALVGSGGSLASGGASLASGGAGPASGGASGAAGTVTYLKASNADAGDLFGISAAFSADGSTLAVGANGEGSSGVAGGAEDDSAPTAGAVYLFSRSGSSWQEQAYLKASSADAGDGFGSTIALSADGNTLAVAAPYEASAADGVDGDQSDDSSPNSGAVYLFARKGGAWVQQAYVKASSSDADDFFGISLALSASGDVLVVGAEGEDGAGTGVGADQTDKTAYESGAVFVFSRSGTSWAQRDYIKASNAGVGDHFGGSVALSAEGSVLAVGAYWEDSAATDQGGDQADDSATSAGAVYLFGYEGSSWLQQAYVKPPEGDGNASDNFGAAVSLSADGSRLAVGAVGDPSAATGIDGDPAGDALPFSGAVYVLDRVGTSFELSAFIKASNTGAGDEFGYHVQLAPDGETLAVGAALEGSGASVQTDESAPEAGAVYVFGHAADSWSQKAYLKAPNVDAGDRFGWTVALSGDGQSLAVGATRESSAATGIEGDQQDDSAVRAGAVYIFSGAL
jgi:hypothetical protein